MVCIQIHQPDFWRPSVNITLLSTLEQNTEHKFQFQINDIPEQFTGDEQGRWSHRKSILISAHLESQSCNNCCSGREEVWELKATGEEEEEQKCSDVGVWKDMCTGEAARFADKEEAECARVKVRRGRERDDERMRVSHEFFFYLTMTQETLLQSWSISFSLASTYIYIIFDYLGDIYCKQSQSSQSRHAHTGEKIQSQQFICCSAENNQVNSVFKENLSVSPPLKCDLLL